MDRARAVSAPVSLGAHALGATVLALGPLLAPEPLPAPRLSQLMPPLNGVTAIVALGQGALARGPRHATPKPTKIVAPSLVVPLSELKTPEPLDPEELSLLPGDGPGSRDPGLCLVDCGGSSIGTVGPPPPLVPEPKKEEVRVRAGGLIRPPEKLLHVAPVYPPLALAARVEGSVVIECVITTEGAVAEVKVLRGRQLLDDAAAAAVSQWRYRPTMLNGDFVSVILTVTVDFRLH